MRTYLALFLFIVIAASCRKKDKPAIEPERMEKVLTDIHIAEAYCVMVNDSLHQIRNKNLDSLALYYSEIFAHHHVTKDEFVQSIAWYKSHPEDLDSIYAHIQVKTGKMETKSGK